MLSAHCPRHGREVLVSTRQILAIEGRGRDMSVRWACSCGHVGVHRPQRPAPTI